MAFSKQADQRLIYIAVGTVYQANLQFFLDCLQAFDDPRYAVVLSVGRAVDPAALGPIPRNFTVAQRKDELVFRVRTPANGENGENHQGVWPGVFVDLARHHLQASYAGRCVPPVAREDEAVGRDYQRHTNAVLADATGQCNDLRILGVDWSVERLVVRRWMDQIEPD